mgnify:CR=1 FL=1
MGLTQKDVDELKRIHEKETGEKLSDEEAWEMAIRLLELGKIVIEGNRKTEAQRLRDKRQASFRNITVVEMKKKTIEPALTKSGFSHIELSAPTIKDGQVEVTGTAQDDNTRRRERGSKKAAESALAASLDNTNWRLVDVSYAIGVVKLKLLGKNKTKNSK